MKSIQVRALIHCPHCQCIVRLADAEIASLGFHLQLAVQCPICQRSFPVSLRSLSQPPPNRASRLQVTDSAPEDSVPQPAPDPLSSEPGRPGPTQTPRKAKPPFRPLLDPSVRRERSVRQPGLRETTRSAPFALLPAEEVCDATPDLPAVIEDSSDSPGRLDHENDLSHCNPLRLLLFSKFVSALPHRPPARGPKTTF
jgi:hypothetical protein